MWSTKTTNNYSIESAQNICPSKSLRWMTWNQNFIDFVGSSKCSESLWQVSGISIKNIRVHRNQGPIANVGPLRTDPLNVANQTWNPQFGCTVVTVAFFAFSHHHPSSPAMAGKGQWNRKKSKSWSISGRHVVPFLCRNLCVTNSQWQKNTCIALVTWDSLPTPIESQKFRNSHYTLTSHITVITYLISVYSKPTNNNMF